MKAHKTELKEYNLFPTSWTDPITGITYSRLFLEALTTEELKVLGWYTITDNMPSLGENEKAVKSALVFNGITIVQNYTKEPIFSPEELAAQAYKEAITARTEAVANIKVVVNGKEFDGDEISQSRMARAVTSSEPLETTQWVLADNTIATVSREELKSALRLAGDAQTAIWVS